MKTAVEWLANNIQEQLDVFFPGAILHDEMINQAKEIEKDQIRIAYMEGAFEKMRHLEGKKFTMPTDYYNETFKS